MVHFSDKLGRLQILATQMIGISDLFKTEPDRLEKFVLREGPIRADFSKQSISENMRWKPWSIWPGIASSKTGGNGFSPARQSTHPKTAPLCIRFCAV